MSERQTEPHQAERPRVSDITPAWMNYADRLEAEVARLRAERDQYREAMGREWKIANDMAADAQEAYRRADAAQNRVAELEAERDEELAFWQDSAKHWERLAHEQEDRIDRAVTERTAEIVARSS